jgi:signal transduction histidine kinase
LKKRFADLSIGTRILIGFGLVAGLLLAVAAYGLAALSYMERAEQEVTQYTNARRAARSLDVDVLNIIVLLQYFVETKDTALLPEVERNRAEANRMRAAIRASTELKASLDKLTEYEKLLPPRRALATDIVGAVRAGRDTTVERLMAERRSLDIEARALLAGIINEQDAAAVNQLRISRERAETVRQRMLIVSVSAVALMILLTGLITRSITRPLRRLQRMTEQIGEGHFEVHTDIDTRDEIGSFARTLNHMTEDIARLDQAKDEFIGLASHQLRTPATAVKNFIGLLREGYAGEMTDEQMSYVNYAWDSNEQQLEVVDGLLRVARSESGRMVLNIQTVDLVALAERVLAQQGGTFRERRQTYRRLVPVRPVHAMADAEYLQMAVENLVSNASKYTPEGGRVIVAVRLDGDTACISVSDNGVGIAPSDMPRLFGKFSRIRNELSTQVGGSGIGLYLTRRIVEQHGGTIEVAPRGRRGSTFTIRLPTGES